MEKTGVARDALLHGASKGDFSREWQARIRMRDERNNGNTLGSE